MCLFPERKEVSSHPGLAFDVNWLFVIKKDLHRLDELLVDGVQEGVLGLDLVLQQHLHHLQVLIVDGHEQRRPTQRVHTVNVDGAILTAVLEHAEI